MSAIAHTYQYLYPSGITDEAKGPALHLATSDAAGSVHPHFFEGAVRQPRLVADLLTAVHLIVGSRFFTPANTVAKLIALADPVVTSGGGLLRFEGFSGCCSTYIRADLLPSAYDGDVVAHGTTNVDFNAPMRAALAKVRDEAGLALFVGRDELRLRSGGSDHTERKVELPTRWIRGMLEVQSYQSSMRRVWTASSVDALRFFRTLPRASTHRTPLWIGQGPGGLYTTTQPRDDGVRLTDATRLRVLEPLLPKAQSLTAFADAAHQACAFVLDFGSARLTLALSAEVWRGFSGEGQALSALMQAEGDAVRRATAHLRAQLAWQASLDVPALASALSIPEPIANDSLRVLGASGLVGFDVFESRYFHRVLPFDVSMHADWHPRLLDARELLQSGALRVVRTTPFEVAVASGGVEHRVREVAGELHCTCPWYAKHQGLRGPCKHALAAATLQH